MSPGCIYLMPFVYDNLQMIRFAYVFLSQFIGLTLTQDNY